MFQPKILSHYLRHQDESLLHSRYEAFQIYQSKQNEIRSLNEEKYQDGFLRDLFVGCLGYTLQPDDGYNLLREEKNEQDAKKADGAIKIDDDITAVIELKDTSTKDLDRPKTRGGKSPVDQLFSYIASHRNARYGIVSNFNELRFYFDKKTEFERFDLFTMDFDAFTLLHLLLSRESIAADLPLEIKKVSDEADIAITKQLYKDYALFRRELFDNIGKRNPAVDPHRALRLTQKLVDRIVFILFAEDTGLLRKNTIREIREEFKSQKFTAFTQYDIYKFYFDAINEGNAKLDILKYNGGLFAEDTELDALAIDDAYLDEQAQILSDYDFASEVSVNILGHIFEHSLSDLEELNAAIAGEEFDAKKSKRKKEGVFYTPEYITHYIVENTLGRLCEAKRTELGLDVEIVPRKHEKKLLKTEQQLLENLQTYRRWLKGLKICDPACGSGAFLNQALTYLTAEHEKVQRDVVMLGDITGHEEIEKEILENNLYGVDINEEACEIARLSLWLKTARRGRELTKLSDKIKSGNSLISDKSVADNAFVWEEEFPEVFEKGGFDVVIGNPPYVRQELLGSETKAYFKEHFKTYHGTADLYVFFVERGYLLLKPNGLFSYIFPNKWMRANYGGPLREWLSDKKIEEIVDFGDLPVFEEATTYPLIMTLRKNGEVDTFRSLEMDSLDFGDLKQFVQSQHSMTDQTRLDAKGWTLSDIRVQLLMEKLRSSGITLGEYVNGEIYRGVLTGLNEAFVIDEGTKARLIAEDAKSAEIIKPFLAGRDIKRYETPKANKFLILFRKGWTREQSGHTDEVHAWEWLRHEYRAIAAWLEPFAKKGRKRYDKGEFWWELRACDYYGKFEKQKIYYPDISLTPSFMLDGVKSYAANTAYFIPIGELKLLGILNSSIIGFFLKMQSNAIRGGYIRYFTQTVETIPLPTANNARLNDAVEARLLTTQNFQNVVIDFTDYCTHILGLEKLTKKLQSPETLTLEALTIELKKKKVNMDDFTVFKSVKTLHEQMTELKKQIDVTDREIDAMVYELYGLTEEESKIVAGNA